MASNPREIANTSDRTLEYASSFALPEGAWVNGFHLVIGDRREPGIIAEHRAAAWIYRQIVGTRRDPGILERQKNGRILALEAGRVSFEPAAVVRVGGGEIHYVPG